MVMLANEFSARGHRVDLVLAKAEGPYLSEVAEGVRILDLGKNRVLASLLPLIRYLRRERPNAMLSAMSHANVVAIIARYLARVSMRLAVSEHNSPSGGFSRRVVDNVLHALIRRLYQSTDSVVCVSRGVREEVEKLLNVPSEKLRIIYNPLDLERIRKMKDVPVQHEWLSGGGSPVILAVGRLTAQKDYPTLLNAFALLRARRAVRLVVLGQGEEEVALKALVDTLGINDDVAFMGFQSNPYAWMAACDLYVLSSRWEGLSCTMQEALACGARIVSTDCPSGPSEVLEDGRWGRLVPVGDAAALAAAMDVALNDKLLPEAGRRAEDFHIDRIADEYGQVLLG